MKKIKILIVLLIGIFAFNINVLAASASLTVSSNSVKEGESFTVYANMKDSAAWNIHVEATGPVEGCTINEADASSDAKDTTKTFSATCTATKAGTINIELTGDVTSASDGNAVNISESTKVTVTEKSQDSGETNGNEEKEENPKTSDNITMIGIAAVAVLGISVVIYKKVKA